MIRRLRADRGITQKLLAQTARVDPGHLSKIESGLRTPSVPVLARLLAALGAVDSDYRACVDSLAGRQSP